MTLADLCLTLQLREDGGPEVLEELITVDAVGCFEGEEDYEEETNEEEEGEEEGQIHSQLEVSVLFVFLFVDGCLPRGS